MRNSEHSPNLILDVSFKLGVQVVLYTFKLKKDKHYVISDQILRSGLSIGSNCKEAQGAESRADFIHKCKIAYKEAEELEFFLKILQAVPYFSVPDQLLELTRSCIRILGKIIFTSKKYKQ